MNDEEVVIAESEPAREVEIHEQTGSIDREPDQMAEDEKELGGEG